MLALLLISTILWIAGNDCGLLSLAAVAHSARGSGYSCEPPCCGACYVLLAAFVLASYGAIKITGKRHVAAHHARRQTHLPP